MARTQITARPRIQRFLKWREHGPVVAPPASGGASADRPPPIRCGRRPLPHICYGSLCQDRARPPRRRFPAVRAASGRSTSPDEVSRACGVAAAGRGANTTRCDDGRILRGPTRGLASSGAQAAGSGALQARQEQLLPLRAGRQKPSEHPDFLPASIPHPLPHRRRCLCRPDSLAGLPSVPDPPPLPLLHLPISALPPPLRRRQCRYRTLYSRAGRFPPTSAPRSQAAATTLTTRIRASLARIRDNY